MMSTMEQCGASELGDWLSARMCAGRYLFGLVGPPGSGKSTLAGRVADELDAVVAPMDGFHLRNRELDRRGLRGVKGAPETFDADAFSAAVRGLRGQSDVIRWPSFDRVTDEPVPDAVVIRRDARLVIVEGNYLLLGRPPWSELASAFDEVGYLEVDHDVRIGRLIERHVSFGRSRDTAAAFVRDSDERNSALVAAARRRASLVIDASR